MNAELQTLVYAYQDYIALLAAENKELIGLAAARGWTSPRAEQGRILRERIGSCVAAASVAVAAAGHGAEPRWLALDLKEGKLPNDAEVVVLRAPHKYYVPGGVVNRTTVMVFRRPPSGVWHPTANWEQYLVVPAEWHWIEQISKY